MPLFLAGLVGLLLQPPAVPLAKPSPPSDTRLYAGRSRMLPPNPEREKRREAAYAERDAIKKLIKGGRTIEAIVRYETLLLADEKERLVYIEILKPLGDLYARQGRLREALDLYRTLVYVKPDQTWITSRSNNPDVRMKFALLLHKAGLYDEALTNYNKGMEGAAKKARLMDVRLPMDPSIFAVNAQTVPTTRFTFAAHMALAACRKNFDKAESMAHLREAIKLRPNQAQPHYYLGYRLLWDEEGKGIVPAPPEAVAELEQAIALDASPSHDTRRVATALLENFRSAEYWKRVHAADAAKTGASEKASSPASP